MFCNMDILNILKNLEDNEYKKFNKKIVNTQQEMIWVRLPTLRKIAKEISKENPMEFVNKDKENIFEMIMLEGLVLSYMDKSFVELLPFTEKFLKKVDSWAQIDTCIWNFKKINKEPDDVLAIVKVWLNSEEEFVCRAGLIILLWNFVKKDRLQMVFDLSEKVENKAYYVHMANAWLISTCMAKFPEETKKFFQKNKLDKITHNKAIQKSIESFRVSDEDKEILRWVKR